MIITQDLIQFILFSNKAFTPYKPINQRLFFVNAVKVVSTNQKINQKLSFYQSRSHHFGISNQYINQIISFRNKVEKVIPQSINQYVNFSYIVRNEKYFIINQNLIFNNQIKNSKGINQKLTFIQTITKQSIFIRSINQNINFVNSGTSYLINDPNWCN